MTDLFPTVRASLAHAAETNARRRRRRRRAPLALVAIAAIAGVLAVGSLPGDVDVVARASAALIAPQGEILHTIVTRTTQTTTGDPTTETVEHWEATDPIRGRLWIRPSRTPVDGVQIAYDGTYYHRTATIPSQSPDQPAAADPIAQIKRLLSEGVLRDAGETTIGGRTVRRLQGQLVDDASVQDLDYDVDPGNYAPLTVRTTLTPQVHGTPERNYTLTTTTSFDLIEQLPLTTPNKQLLEPTSDQTGASLAPAPDAAP